MHVPMAWWHKIKAVVVAGIGGFLGLGLLPWYLKHPLFQLDDFCQIFCIKKWWEITISIHLKLVVFRVPGGGLGFLGGIFF